MFEFEITFYDNDSLNPVTFSKHKYQQTSSQFNLNAHGGSGAAPANNMGSSSSRGGEDEYEDLNGESVSSASLQAQGSSAAAASQKVNFKKFNFGKPVEQHYCDRVFSSCSSQSSDACVISSPSYPGMYLKNLTCRYQIKNTFLNRSNEHERLLIINDNLQLDGSICHYDPKISGQYATSFFCDAGPRSSPDCQDFVSIYDDSGSAATSKPVLVRTCGMGRLPKIITSKGEVTLELTSAADGLFANHGFLFYVMTEKSYFANYNFFNQFDRSEVRNDYELSSLKTVERLQIENCEWSAFTCVLTITDEILDEIYMPRRSRGRQAAKNSDGDDVTGAEREPLPPPVEDGYFKIAYLFGINQYHAEKNGFTLKYVIKSKRFNTIAIFVEKYKPAAGGSSSSSSSSAYGSKGGSQNIIDCETNDFSIETSNRMLHRYI
jgi:hypothetical protein